jgi:hypothetical protein
LTKAFSIPILALLFPVLLFLWQSSNLAMVLHIIIFYDPATQFADYGLITILMNFKVITKKVIHTKHKELKTSTITG